MIKYYFQEGPSFHHDKKNCGVILLENNYFKKLPTRKEMEIILQKDGVNIHKVECIKYWNTKIKAWIEYTEKQLFDLKPTINELKLLIKYRPDDYLIPHITSNAIFESFNSANQNNYPNNHFTNIELLTRKVNNLEIKFKEIDQRLSFVFQKMHLDDVSPFDLNLSRKKSSNLGLVNMTSLALHKYNSSNLDNNFDIIEENQESTLDIALFYSNPLVKIEHDREYALSDPIELR